MNRRDLVPSMSLLEAFEASARHGSFTRAGDELALTQSAVSRQVQALEAQLGVALFGRAGRRIVLTEVGATYAREIAAALARIRGASAQAVAFKTGVGSLQLAILPTFGSKWLLPRLNAFHALHPGVLVHIHSRIGEFDLSQSGMDAAISAGDGHWTGRVAHKLLEDARVVIASPKLLVDRPLHKPEDLYGHVLLGVSTRPQAWRDWFTAQQLSWRGLQIGTQFEFTAHLIQAVAAGMGVGVVTRVLVEEELRSGSLVIPFDVALPGRHSYYLTYPPEKERFPPLVAFRDWVLDASQNTTPARKITLA
jgi:LysR family glycine cleavage system transcriptional activator